MADTEPIVEADRRDAPVSGDIQAVARVCRILEMFCESSGLMPSDIARTLDLQRPTVSRYLSSLVRERFLGRAQDGSYVIGPTLLELGIAAVGKSPVANAGPYMRRLVQEVQETVVLSVWGGDGPVISNVEEDDSRLVHVSVRVGSSLPFDAAQSQVFLAYLPDREEVDRLLRRFPEAAQRDMRTQLRHVSQLGFAVNSRVVDGMRAVAAPVFGRDGTIEATLAIVGTTATVPQRKDSHAVQALLRTARQLSWHQGHRPAPDADDNFMEVTDGT
ncbi:MAG: IclR family transcriptional regulator [Chloroflexota bacterium]